MFPSRLILTLFLFLSAFAPEPAHASFRTATKWACGQGLSIFSTTATYPFGSGGISVDVAVQGLLNGNGLGNPHLFRRAVRRRLEGQTALNFEWQEDGPRGPSVVLTPRDAAHPLAQFVRAQNDQGVTVVWTVLPAYLNGVYLPRPRRLLIHHLDLSGMKLTHYTLHEGDHAALHVKRDAGKHSGPVFTLLYEAFDLNRDNATIPSLDASEEFWTYPRSFLNILKNTELTAFARRQALLESFPGWNQILERTKFRLGVVLSADNPEVTFNVPSTAEDLWGELPLKWIRLTVANRVAEIPTRLSTGAPDNEVRKDAKRRLVALQDLVGKIILMQVQLQSAILDAKGDYTPRARKIVEAMVAVAEANLRDASDPK